MCGIYTTTENNFISQKIIGNLHIFILQRQSNIHDPYCWVSDDEFFYFFAHWYRVNRSTFLQFTLPLRAPFCAWALKMIPYYGDFVTIVFWSLGKWPTLLSKWMVIDHQGHYMRRCKGPLWPFCKNLFGSEFFDIFWKKLNRFSKKKLNVTTCIGQLCHSTCISPKYI